MAIAITVASGYLVYRQRLTAYQMVRSFVLGVYFLILLLLVLDLARVTVGTQSFLPFYAPSETLLGVLQGVLLLSAAQGVYLSQSLTFRQFPKEVVRHLSHLGVLVLFVALALGAIIYNAFFSPYVSTRAIDFAGNIVPAVSLDPRLLALVFFLFFVFLTYPTALLLLGAAKVENDHVKLSIYGLAGGWAVVTVLYVVTSTTMWVLGVDYMGPMYLANAVIFFFVIRSFRSSTAIAGFVEQKRPQTPTGPVEPPHGLTSLAGSLVGKKVLYEVDPSVPYEATIGQILEELAWAGHAVFVFSPKSSPLHNALSGGTGLKFFLTSGAVSYIKVAEDTHEVLIPQNDTAVILDVVDKTLSSNRDKVVFVFDSVSELLLMIGLEKSYKFLKQFVELLHEPRATGFFILIRKGHESKEANLLRGIFPNQFLEDSEGPRLLK